MAEPTPPPLHTTYEPYANEVSLRTEIKYPKCQHELYLVSSTHARCRKCPVGYQGAGILALVQASQA